MSRNEGYTIVMLLVAASILAIGILAAVPLWQTQIQRENEDELIFRGNQYVEAIRRYQTKNPGQFPRTMDELYKKRYLRRLFPDPMTKGGKWDILIQQTRMAPSPARTGVPTQSGGLQLLAVPEAGLSSVPNAGIVGVVSTSTKTSIRIYNEETTYDKWFFYYGQGGKAKAEVTYYGRPDKK